MKVLMIDDEPLARIGIRSIIPWEENGFILVGEAKNGVEGLELAKKYTPDIILVDIIMPEMDGLEFIRQVKSLLPDCKIIIMSCMNEIQYYREAIHLNVSEYILKDKITPEEILDTVNRIANELRRDRLFDDNDTRTRVINKNIVLTEFLNLVLQGQIRDCKKITGKLEQYGIRIAGRRFLVACISVHYLNHQEKDNEGGFWDYSLISLCQEAVSVGCGGYVFKSFDGNIASVLLSQDNDDGELYIQRLFSQMKETAEQCMDCCITMGISGTFTGADSIYEGYMQARSAVEISFFKGRGYLYSYLRDYHPDVLLLKKADKILHEMLKTSSITDVQRLRSSLTEITRLLSGGGVTFAKARSIYMDILYHILSLLRDKGVDLAEIMQECTDAYSFFNLLDSSEAYSFRLMELIEKTENYWVNHSGIKNNNIISEIQQYVENHLQEKITLDRIACEVYLSSSYLCRLYKKKTGENLQDYILSRKIEKAKKLLSQYNVGEASDLLGFNSHSYFIRVFREKTGCTPLQYQKDRKKI